MLKQLLCITLAGLLFSSFASAQQRDLPRKMISGKGKIKGIRPGLLAVENERGQQWLVKVDAKPQSISFVASAEPDWLRRGMLVKFQNTFSQKGDPLSEVRQLEVISPRRDTKLGLIPASKFGAAANLFSDEDDSAKKKPANQTKSFTVAGKLRGFKNGKMLVSAGRAAVQSELDEKATISVDVSDYSLARKGDSIEFDGWYYLGHKDRVVANRIKISSSRKLGAAKPKEESKNKENSKKDDVEKSLEDLFSN